MFQEKNGHCDTVPLKRKKYREKVNFPEWGPILKTEYNVVFTNKRSQAKVHIYCIFNLLVAYRQYRQQQCSGYSFTIGSLMVSQFRPFTLLYLLSAGSLAMSHLSPSLQVLGELLTLLLLDLLSLQFP